MVRLSDTVERTMFYNAKSLTFERAKVLRQNPTDAEKMIWDLLSNKKMLGLRFKRQHPISIFIADFYCHSLKLVIEVDGEIHNNVESKEYDVNRTAELERNGITVIRFTNNQVISNLVIVKEKIEVECRRLIG
ncbi:MAG TPA: endonuclease domain-containing protein [Tenuifilaceae bacterium]|nr:endonuclease domain-containing protein [Tenuifilaceae bacterium]